MVPLAATAAPAAPGSPARHQLGRPTDVLLDVDEWHARRLRRALRRRVDAVPPVCRLPAGDRRDRGAVRVDAARGRRRSTRSAAARSARCSAAASRAAARSATSSSARPADHRARGGRERIAAPHPCGRPHRRCNPSVSRLTIPSQPVIEGTGRSRAHAALRTRRTGCSSAKFCVVGAVGYADQPRASTRAADSRRRPLPAAATCSFLVAVTSNYMLNRYWTFHDRRAGSRFAGYAFLRRLARLARRESARPPPADHARAGPAPAQAIAIVLVTPLNFIGNKLWSFRLR